MSQLWIPTAEQSGLLEQTCAASGQQSLKPVGAWGWVSAIDSNGRTIWIADAHRDDGKRFVVRADEKLTAFLELESAVRTSTRRIDARERAATNTFVP